MKVRSGFVSNSSSSSFIIWCGDELKSADDLQYWLGDCGSYTVDEIKYKKKTRQSVRMIKSMYRRDLINKSQMEHMLNLIEKADYWNGELSDKYISAKAVAKRIWEKSGGIHKLKYHRAKTPEDADYPIQYSHRKLYAIPDWVEQLKNPQGYLRSVIKENLGSYFSDQQDVDFERNHGDRRAYLWNCVIPSLWLYSSVDGTEGKVKRALDKLVDSLTDLVVENILEEYAKDDKEYKVYMISWCTDDSEGDDIDSLGRQGKITKECSLVIRDEHS